MILWNRSAIEWQAHDTIDAFLDAARERGQGPEALATARLAESRLEQALESLDAAIRDVNGLARPARVLALHGDCRERAS